jgi:hypothetical protein
MFYPLFAMVLLTFVIMIWTFISRVQAVQQGKLSIRYFRLMQGEAPEAVIKASRQFANLFEMPVLFYVLILLSLIKNTEDIWQVRLAWIYVLCRCVQAIIHLSYNKVNHRMAAFVVGNLVLLVLWLRAFSFIFNS